MNRCLCTRLTNFSNSSSRNYKTVKFWKGMSQLRDLHKRDREIIFKRKNSEKEAVKQAKKDTLAAIPPIILFKLSCPGCGARYQHKFPGRPGYLLYETMMAWEPSTTLPCARCESLAESGQEQQMYSISEKRFGRLLQELASKKALGLVVCDVVGFPSSLPPNLENILPPGSPLILVLNKCDVLTESVTQMEIIRTYYELLVSKWAHHAAITFNDILFVSAKTGSGLPELAQVVQNYMYSYSAVESDPEFCYLMGVTNVGKSTLFNKLIPLLNNKVKSLGSVTESSLPGTTVSKIICPIFPASKKRGQTNVAHSLNQKAYKLEKLLALSKHEHTPDWFKSQLDNQLQNYTGAKVMVDTPGVLADNIIPKSATFSGSKIYRHDVALEPGQCLVLGCFRVYYVRGNLSVQFSANVPLETNLEIMSHVDDASLSFSESGNQLGNKVYVIQSINLPPNLVRRPPTADICLSSLGWVSVQLSASDDITVVVFGPRVEDIMLRRPGFAFILPTPDHIGPQ